MEKAFSFGVRWVWFQFRRYHLLDKVTTRPLGTLPVIFSWRCCPRSPWATYQNIQFAKNIFMSKIDSPKSQMTAAPNPTSQQT